MLFDIWQQTARRLRDRDALVDVRRGRRLSFAELDRLAAAGKRLQKGEIAMASITRGLPAFVAATLRAWRDRAVLCPHEGQPPDARLLRGIPGDIAHVKITSGTTGRARFVLFREAQLLADCENIHVAMEFDAALPNLGVISPAHSYGFSHLILQLLLKGMTLWHVPDPLPESMRLAFGSGQRFFLPAVPAMWRSWHRAGILKGAPIIRAMSAGAPLPIDLERQVYADCGIKIHNFYGASECGAIAYDGNATPRTDATSVGRAVQGVSLSIDEEGSLMIRSGAVGVGYWPPEPEGDSMLGDGVFTASDIAEIRPDGVHLLGRRSDTINLAGRKVSPSEIEAAILACPHVQHCVVFGVPSANAARVEEIVGCVNPSIGLTQAELVSFLSDRLPVWQVPRHWWFNDELVPNERGKIPRSLWKKRFIEREAGVLV